MIKLGIFIIPNFYLRNKILNLKKKVKQQFGDQTYLAHLPHCTIYVLKTTDKNFKTIKKIKNIHLKYKKIFFIEKADVFNKDPITKKNTYIIKIKKNNFLKNLQNVILAKLSKYALKNNENYKNKVMKNNNRLYGYPFVKVNWKPHFTIASISINKDQFNFNKSFKKLHINKKQILNSVYIYQIKKDKHKFLCKINIK